MEWESLDALLEVIADILLIDTPISVNEQPIEDTPIHIAAVWGDVRAIDMLISAGANVNTKGDLSCTALYNAVSFGHYRCAKMLIEAGATLDDINELGTSAQDKALKSENEQLVKLFA
jgi:ankyrin repeat protein